MKEATGSCSTCPAVVNLSTTRPVLGSAGWQLNKQVCDFLREQMNRTCTAPSSKWSFETTAAIVVIMVGKVDT